MADGREIWFEYRIQGSRLKAVPVNAKGWAALLVLVAFPLMVTLPIGQLTWGLGPAPFVISLVTSLTLVFFAVRHLLRTRGRERY
ncbi:MULTISPECIES: hypothetical protein [unclassified Sphingomonas]|uniref:hypothetical protein n=1 Tax=unclassified Sphingomonas TaxID=196159 RepID=UPI000BD006CB|nr:MAG: hypothetical protein B7Z43_02485 [Sphingomonas sp. 12-62-6]OYX39114.1 MAG: hypothetical protein B7Y98_06760 [Sphingomonas sp. 32-62-10]OYY63488.1 MAG: hypothetical protein B7Y49_12970 [Sphingomonas sp. 28-62-11]